MYLILAQEGARDAFYHSESAVVLQKSHEAGNHNGQEDKEIKEVMGKRIKRDKDKESPAKNTIFTSKNALQGTFLPYLTQFGPTKGLFWWFLKTAPFGGQKPLPFKKFGLKALPLTQWPKKYFSG